MRETVREMLGKVTTGVVEGREGDGGYWYGNERGGGRACGVKCGVKS